MLLPRLSNLLVEHAAEGGSCSSGTVGQWLDSIKMGRYAQLFQEGGYSSLDTVAHMTSEWVKDLQRVRLVRSSSVPTPKF